MPTYEYQCRSCGHRFEELQSINDQPLSTCPECSGGVERLMSAGAGFIFKGAGFYATDYRSKEYTKQAASESGPAAATAADTKPAAPVAPKPAGGKP
ncbi:MAG: zinc ribbon domain-containing protein [Candidatus Edwardsbacteria bacterium]|jgi:putative FmdB family regulatory protein|nr:zinc ribbon domain-containing protein [Candidatus Edwardsbacteria bacterium]